MVRARRQPRCSSAPVAPPEEEVLQEVDQALEPPCYVVAHDDPVTTMAFVVEVFRTVFGLSQARAYERMMRVHTTGAAVIGSWPRSEARRLVDRAVSRARAQGFPLTFTIEDP